MTGYIWLQDSIVGPIIYLHLIGRFELRIGLFAPCRTNFEAKSIAEFEAKPFW